ncbi:MAG TPA: hypothetical protein PKN70_03605 [Smithellaceae bacterium]|nr:hypothetical protein [Smithellaceae bacterium]HQM44917.1 hypothetical protein [Smithellaceae bacterium]
MLKFFIAFMICIMAIFSAPPWIPASDLCCIGKTSKDVRGVCIVKNFQEGRICLEEISDGKSKSCWGLSGCYELKDHGQAKPGSQVIVTDWRAGDMKCYQGPNCGKVMLYDGN